jgi:cytochrome P450
VDERVTSVKLRQLTILVSSQWLWIIPLSPFSYFPSIPNPHRSKCITARNLFTQNFQEVIDERTAKQKDDPDYKPPENFLLVLMRAKYNDGTILTTTEITGILIGVLLGGHHTTSVTGGTYEDRHLVEHDARLVSRHIEVICVQNVNIIPQIPLQNIQH